MKPQARPEELHVTITKLLKTHRAGSAVASELSQRYADWQARAVIADLRARRMAYRITRVVASKDGPSPLSNTRH